MTVVYIEAGGWEVLQERALSRAPMSDEELAKRYERFQHEEKSKPLADVIIDNTGDMEIAKAEFMQVIDAAINHTTT